jgi:hypothetical protein
MLVATVLVLLILILPPLAISWVVPAQDVSLTAGIMQASMRCCPSSASSG